MTNEGLRRNVSRVNQRRVVLPQLAALLSVQFKSNGCRYVFFWRVLRSESDGDRYHFIVHAPEDIGASECRVGFRINVPEALPMGASLLVEGTELPLKVHDISPAGPPVSLPEGRGLWLDHACPAVALWPDGTAWGQPTTGAAAPQPIPRPRQVHVGSNRTQRCEAGTSATWKLGAKQPGNRVGPRWFLPDPFYWERLWARASGAGLCKVYCSRTHSCQGNGLLLTWP